MIGVYVPALNESQRDEIRRAADEGGFEAHFHEALPDARALEGTEVFFGALPPEMLRELGSLRWLHCPMAGVDRYSDRSLYASGDVILSNSNAFGVAIAEHVICVLLMMMKHMDFYRKVVCERRFEKKMPIDSIAGSRIAVIGTGDIGMNFGVRARALGAKVVGVRTRAVKPEWCDEIYAAADMKEAVRDCDAVVASLPLTPETRDIFDGGFFRAMKEGSYFVNVGRGLSVDEEALCEALDSGRLAGAALDVFRQEPLPKDSPLWEQKGLLITPHSSGDMALAYTRQRITDIFVEALREYAGGKRPSCAVDMDRGY